MDTHVQADEPTPDPPPGTWGGRALVRFLVVHVVFVVICMGIAVAVFAALGGTRTMSIGPGKDYPTLDAANRASDRKAYIAWDVIILVSVSYTFGMRQWRREYGLPWVIASAVPMLGQLFFTIPASWVLANRTLRAPPTKHLGSTDPP